MPTDDPNQAGQPSFYDDNHPYYARRSPESLAMSAVEIVNQIRSTRASAGLTAMMRRHWYRYYNLDDGKVAMSDTLTEDGEQGRRVRLRVNHFRSLIRRIITNTTQQRPALRPKAKNTDERSAKQTKIGKSVLEHYFDGEGYWKYFERAVEHALILTAGFVHMPWDESKGELYDVLPPSDPQTPSRFQTTGDFRPTNPILFDMFFDHSRSSWDDLPDLIVREWQNRYEVAEEFRATVPDIDSLIGGVPNRKQEADSWRALPVLFFTQMDSVEIEVFTYYHKPTRTLPNGRQLKFLADGTVLDDRPLPYRCIPVFRIVEADMMGTPQGYTTASDLAPIQEGHEIIRSAILTNQKAFGVQGICVPTGSNIQLESLNGGLGVIYYTPIPGPDGGKPTPLQLTQTPKEMFDNGQMMVEEMEAVSGINATSRGNPPPGLDAGVAINLVQSDSIIFQDPLRKSLTAALQQASNHMIETLRTNPQADLPRLVQLVGKTDREALVEFKGSQLEGVGRVVVDMGNPLEWTVAGRASMAKAMVDSKMVRTPEELLQVYNTGRIEVLTEADTSELDNVRRENEMLMDWQPPPGWMAPPPPPPPPPGMPPMIQPPWPGVPPVLAGDNDSLHIKEHLALLSNPDIRMNGQCAQAVLKHVNDHADKFQAGDRILMIIQGLIPQGPQPMAPPGGGPAGAGGPPPPGPPHAAPPPGGPTPQHHGAPPMMPGSPMPPPQMPAGPQQRPPFA